MISKKYLLENDSLKSCREAKRIILMLRQQFSKKNEISIITLKKQNIQVNQIYFKIKKF